MNTWSAEELWFFDFLMTGTAFARTWHQAGLGAARTAAISWITIRREDELRYNLPTLGTGLG